MVRFDDVKMACQWGWFVCWFGVDTKLWLCPQGFFLCVFCWVDGARDIDGVVSFGLITWLVVDLDWFSWLPLPGLWAGFYFYLVFLCPGCGLVLSMVGMLVDMLGSLSVGFGFGGFVSG